MARWQPNARERLETAAFALFAEQGYESTTVAQIAERAGLTERTFFRHYTDKKEVLFWGQSLLEETLAAQATEAAPEAAPIDVVEAAFATMARMIAGRGTLPFERQRVIDATPALRERELHKMDALARTLATTLAGRGAAARTARVLAGAGVAAFTAAYEEWIAAEGAVDLEDVTRRAFADLRDGAGGR
ncbi:TetR/AcrR family transcriptional regulator [Tsukamurella paurometabola]|uniref:TetR family transcriptional regulator n=1 Tax=Tsukamurella paurometabola TaxID=2061 RepID=A0ABS5N6J0_TSUPA|nr:TetR/AcrR family transcriptional regulator [Tsukamurella paurometabola]MBS4099889.1 TetR family transcriptional regulator [Tsukamurella paurometabola]